MRSTIATILGTAALGFIKSRVGSGAKIVPCDEIKLDMTLRLFAPSTNLTHIDVGWNASKFINQMNIIDVSIKCVAKGINLDIPEELVEEFGEYIYAYFEVFVKLKGRLENLEGELTKDNITYQLILDTIKELWVENILLLAPNAETEIQTNNEFSNYFSINTFMKDYNNISDINAGFYGPQTSVNNSFYVTDEKGSPIDYMTKKDKSKLRKR